MLLFVLFIEIFFTPASGLFECAGGPDCHVKLNFNEILPTKRELSSICSITNVSTCSMYAIFNYNKKEVDVLFRDAPKDIKSIYSITNLLENNLQAAIIVRYAVKVKTGCRTNVRLYVLIECKTDDRCAEQQLRHFWGRLTLLYPRRNIFQAFHQLLSSNSSKVRSCFDDQKGVIQQCFNDENICWATVNDRRCLQYNESTSFIYSYNKVDLPHQLTTDDVRYTLACHTDNCNHNDTIHEVSREIFPGESQ